MAGFTKIPKLQVDDLGTEGTGDRIALFNSDGRLIGYVLKESLENFVPLSGTEVGKPITGKLVFEDIGAPQLESLGSDILLKTGIYMLDNSIQFYRTEDNYETSESVQFDHIGLIGSKLFNKNNIPNVFAQLGDIATTNETVSPLSLSYLNTTYGTRCDGFKVICREINKIYVKVGVNWEEITTTTVV